MPLPVAHYGRAIEGVFALVHAQWNVKHQPFPQVAEQLRQPLRNQRRDGDASRTALDVRNALLAACRHLPWKPTCLVRAVAGQTLLTRRGIPSVLVLSVMPQEGLILKAHAWLEAAGTVVIGRHEMASYTPIYRFDNHPDQPDDQPARTAAPCSH